MHCYKKMNNNINEVVTNLYEALVSIRYPGVAEIDISNVESIVSKNHRIHMLHWLSTQAINIVAPDSVPPTTDETSIVEWYTGLGVCSNEKALLGECPLKDQLETLYLLRDFIENIFNNTHDVNSIDKSASELINELCNMDFNIIPPTFNMTDTLSYDAAQAYVKDAKAYIKDSQNNDKLSNIKTCTTETVLENPKMTVNNPDKTDSVENGSTESHLNNNEINREQVFEEFYESFKSMEVENHDGQKNDKNVLDKYMETIPQQLSTLKQVIDTKHDISEIVSLKESVLKKDVIDEIVQDVTITAQKLVEKYCENEN